MARVAQEKLRTNVTLDAEMLKKARSFGLNISAISNDAVKKAVAAAEAEAWASENAQALAERRTWIEKNGMPLASVQVLQID